jgi:hypothetical protein
MYRDEDIDQIKLNVDSIAEKAMMIYKTTYEPTLKESKDVYNDIIEYIKTNKKIIYGGWAQNSLIMLKNKNDGFYKESDTPDIEFYSYEPLKDLAQLCDFLYSKKYKFVQGSEGVHSGTYKIFVNFINYCDITYLPKNIYDNLQYIEDNNKLRYANPYFLYIDIFRVFTDPMTSYWRLDKSFKRFLRLYRYYPLKYPENKQIKFTNIVKEDILKVIRKHIIQDSKYIVVGTYAYNYYIKKVNKEPVKINFYEIISENIKEDAHKILKTLQKHFNNKITVKEYYPFFEFFDYRIEFLYEDNVILRVYGNNNRCIVYNKSEKKKTYFGTTQIIFLYLISNYNYYIVNRNKNDANNYLIMFLNLNDAKQLYLEKNNITVLDNSPFEEFKFNCIGMPVDILRLEKLEIMKKKEENKLLKYRYEPSNKPNKIPEYIFDNISGNMVINSKYFIIKNI